MILLLQSRTDISGPHEVKCFYKFCKIPYNKYFLLNLASPKVTKSLVEDLISRSKGVILGGLAEGGYEDFEDPSVSQEKKDRLRKTIEFVTPIIFDLIKEDIPTIAICFGHQLVLKELGGTLTFDPKYAETGIFKIYTTKEAANDPVFDNMQPEFWAVLGHKTSVLTLPKKPKFPIKHLAYSKASPVQAVKVNNKFYSVQFHPELDKDELVYRLQFYPSYIQNNPDAINKLPDVKVDAPKILINWLKNVVGEEGVEE